MDKVSHIKLYDGEDRMKLQGCFGVYADRLTVSEEKYMLTTSYNYWHQKYKDFRCRKDDVWVLSYPKSGTTWAQELVWCLLHDVEDKGNKQLLMKRFPFFEWDALLPEGEGAFPEMDDEDPCKPGVTWRILNTIEDPRPIKSHLHFDLLPSNLLSSGAKIIYICRDPKDVCVSYYYHSIKLDGFSGNFSEFFDLFLKDLHFYSPFWKHVFDFWDRRNHPNILFIRYEELTENLEKMIYRVAEFLGKTVSGEYVEMLMEHLSFSNMSSNAAVNNECLMSVDPILQEKTKFMRKGKVGDWIDHFSEEQLREFKKWTKMNLKDVTFPYYRD